MDMLPSSWTAGSREQITQDLCKRAQQQQIIIIIIFGTNQSHWIVIVRINMHFSPYVEYECRKLVSDGC